MSTCFLFYRASHIVVVVLLTTFFVSPVHAHQAQETIMPDAEAFAIGQRIWKNDAAEHTRQAIDDLKKETLPHMLRGLSPNEADHVRTNFDRIAQESFGFYALLDYMHFKGDGTNWRERYHGQGWGLLQVLEVMPTMGPALKEFVKSAEVILQRRIHNAPADRHDEQYWHFWKKRLHTYLES
jgi:hypothetical protein